MRLHLSTAAERGEPLWLPAARCDRRRIPAHLRPWLLDRASLTRRLQEHCPGRFAVEVLAQGWRRPMRNEVLALGTRRTTRALVREVRLLCHGEPLVFARTVIPAATLQGRRRRLGRLGSRPLGAVLFADPSMRRGELELSCMGPGQRLFDTATRGLAARPQAIWGRRSLFFLGERPLLVQEIFLPAVPAYRTAAGR